MGLFNQSSKISNLEILAWMLLCFKHQNDAKQCMFPSRIEPAGKKGKSVAAVRWRHCTTFLPRRWKKTNMGSPSAAVRERWGSIRGSDRSTAHTHALAFRSGPNAAFQLVFSPWARGERSKNIYPSLLSLPSLPFFCLSSSLLLCWW